MTEEISGAQAGREGITEGVKGKAKEMTGAATGHDALEREGQAQQDKAASLRQVSEKEDEADDFRPKVGVGGFLIGEGQGTQPEKLSQKEAEADDARVQASADEDREHTEHAQRKQ